MELSKVKASSFLETVANMKAPTNVIKRTEQEHSSTETQLNGMKANGTEIFLMAKVSFIQMMCHQVLLK